MTTAVQWLQKCLRSQCCNILKSDEFGFPT